MKLLFILPEFHPGEGGGIITFYKNLLVALRPACERIKVIVGSGYTQDQLETIWHDIEIEYLEPARYQKYLQKFNRFDIVPSFKSNLAAAWAMHEQARAGEGFDVVECNDFGIGYLPWVLNQRLPVIVRLHGSSGQITYHDPIPDENLAGDIFRQAEILTLNRAAAVHTYSTDNQIFWEAQLNRPVLKISPIYLPPPGTHPLSRPERSASGIVTGRLQYWKGPVTVAKALQIRKVETTIEWYGRDMHFTDPKKMMSGYLSENFEDIWQKKLLHRPRISSAEALSLQKTALYGLVPSTWDMFNMSCLEFMSVGTPVICSEGAGVHDLITDKVNGFRFRADDEHSLLEKIESLLSLSAVEYEQISKNAFETISIGLSPEKLLPVYLDGYRQAFKNFQPLPVNDYLSTIYAPDVQAQDIGDLLDRQPLSRLLPYVKRRLLQKIGIR